MPLGYVFPIFSRFHCTKYDKSNRSNASFSNSFAVCTALLIDTMMSKKKGRKMRNLQILLDMACAREITSFQTSDNSLLEN